MVRVIGQLEQPPSRADAIRLVRMVNVIFPATVAGVPNAGSRGTSLTIRTRRMESFRYPRGSVSRPTLLTIQASWMASAPVSLRICN